MALFQTDRWAKSTRREPLMKPIPMLPGDTLPAVSTNVSSSLRVPSRYSTVWKYRVSTPPPLRSAILVLSSRISSAIRSSGKWLSCDVSKCCRTRAYRPRRTSKMGTMASGAQTVANPAVKNPPTTSPPTTKARSAPFDLTVEVVGGVCCIQAAKSGCSSSARNRASLSSGACAALLPFRSALAAETRVRR